jgi:hypothetical protein
LNVVPFGGVSWSDTLLAILPVRDETDGAVRIDRVKNAAQVETGARAASARVRFETMPFGSVRL